MISPVRVRPSTSFAVAVRTPIAAPSSDPSRTVPFNPTWKGDAEIPLTFVSVRVWKGSFKV